jgi:hypothetical protein
MPRRRALKSVLSGLLGTFTGRNSDYRGYWTLGQLEPELSSWRADLLNPPHDPSTISDVAARQATRRFAEQLAKHGLTPSIVVEAQLESAMRPEPVTDWAGDHRASGHLVDFVAYAVTDTGRRYERTASVFVAPHSVSREFRRSREHWGT